MTFRARIALFMGMSTQFFGQTQVTDAWQQPNQTRAVIVLFIPENADPPEDYQIRLSSAGLRTEIFFDNWLKHWGYEVERNEIFDRNANGEIDVEIVRAKLKDVKANDVVQQISRTAVQEIKWRKRLGKNNGIHFWIFYKYPGVKGFVGGQAKAVNAYPKGGTGAIRLEAHLASTELQETQIKGSMHEFGHAMGLPHNGPRKELGLGNSLMGPITPKYMSKARTRNPRVYLNEVSAAMLWKHPLFKKEKPRPAAPPRNIRVSNLKVIEKANGAIQLSGKMTANRKAHSAIVFDSKKEQFGMDYWSRSFVGKIEDGSFTVEIKKPQERGTLYLAFCFNNGVNTGDGKRLNKSFIEIPYSGKRGKKNFSIPN